MVLKDMVFQGTVWGPTLWNVFYEDAALPIRDNSFTEVVYADDLNAYAEVDKDISNTEAFEQARTCQTLFHTWGRANQVSFDASKESFHVLSQHEPEGEDFKLLGVLFDCQLRMEGAVKELAQEAG